MKESIHKYFALGTIQCMSFPNDLMLDTIHKIACDDYFDVLELRPMPDEETKIKAKELLDQSYLKVLYGAQPFLLGEKLNPNEINEEERLKAEKNLIEKIDEAYFLGSKGLAFLSGKWKEETKEQSYQQLIKTTCNLCAYAAKKDMMIELEVFDFDMDKASLIGPAPLAARFAADIRSKHSNFGLLVDLSHFPTTYETSKFVIQTLRPYITHFHIGNAVVEKDCEAYGDMHPRFGFPNSANDVEELTEFFKVLKEEGFFNSKNPYVLSLEVKPWKNENPDIILANTKRVINRAWALLED